MRLEVRRNGWRLGGMEGCMEVGKDKGNDGNRK